MIENNPFGLSYTDYDVSVVPAAPLHNPSTNKYVVVTAITQFRSRFVVPLDELQQLNPSVPVDPKWALDLVTCNEVAEFSQLSLGDAIISHEVVGEDAILALFDADNEYLSSWTPEQKLQHIRRWEA